MITRINRSARRQLEHDGHKPPGATVDVELAQGSESEGGWIDHALHPGAHPGASA